MQVLRQILNIQDNFLSVVVYRIISFFIMFIRFQRVDGNVLFYGRYAHHCYHIGDLFLSGL